MCRVRSLYRCRDLGSGVFNLRQEGLETLALPVESAVFTSQRVS